MTASLLAFIPVALLLPCMKGCADASTRCALRDAACGVRETAGVVSHPSSLIPHPTHNVLGFAWLSVYARFVNRMRVALTRPAIKAWLERVTGGALVLLGARLAWDRR